MDYSKIRCLTSILALCALVSAPAFGQQRAVNLIGRFQFPGANDLFPYGINEFAEISGSYTDTMFHGFLLEGALPKGIKCPGTPLPEWHRCFISLNRDGKSTAALGLNDRGQIVGGSDAGGFLWSGGMFSDVSFAPGAASTPWDISNSGTIAGYYCFWNPVQCEPIIGVPVQCSTDTKVYGINASGTAVGFTYSDDGIWHAFEGGCKIIDPPGTQYAQAVGINRIGEVLIQSGGRFFLRFGGAYTELTGLSSETAPTIGAELLTGTGDDLGGFVAALSCVDQNKGSHQKDRMTAEYVTYGVNFGTYCSYYTDSASSQYFQWPALNSSDYDWALVRKPLIAPASGTYGLDKWKEESDKLLPPDKYGPRKINSAYRNPAKQFHLNPRAPQGRHQYGDAVDFRNNSCKRPGGCSEFEYKQMRKAACMADADYVEKPVDACAMNCVHADWRDHDKPWDYVQ